MQGLTLGKEVTFVYQGDKMRGFEIFGDEVILGQRDGKPYLKRWYPDFENTSSPAQRTKKVFTGEEVDYCCFPDLGGIERGLLLALIQGKLAIDRFEEFEKIFKDEIRQGIVEIVSINDQNASKIRSELMRFCSYTIGSPKQGMKEAVKQVVGVYLLKDKTGRINPCAIFARITAIESRIAERLGELHGWMPHFSGRLFAVKAIQRAIERTIHHLPASLNLVARNKDLGNINIGKAQITAMRNLIQIQRKKISLLSVFDQFKKWTEHVIMDLAELDQAVERNNSDEAVLLIKKLRESVQIKRVQLDMERLLERIDLDMLVRTYDWGYYFQQLSNINQALSNVNEENFYEPVCKKARKKLQPAFVSHNATDIQLFKKHIKQAHACL